MRLEADDPGDVGLTHDLVRGSGVPVTVTFGGHSGDPGVSSCFCRPCEDYRKDPRFEAGGFGSRRE